MGRIREDIHIHSSAGKAFARLETIATYGEWLPSCFRNLNASSSGFECLLSLPLRTEPVRLVAVERQAPQLIQFHAIEPNHAFDLLSWVLSPEGTNDVHLLVEATYTPSGGFIGSVFDMLVQRAHRRQALRDAVWRLKHVLENNSPITSEDK